MASQAYITTIVRHGTMLTNDPVRKLPYTLPRRWRRTLCVCPVQNMIMLLLQIVQTHYNQVHFSKSKEKNKYNHWKYCILWQVRRIVSIPVIMFKYCPKEWSHVRNEWKQWLFFQNFRRTLKKFHPIRFANLIAIMRRKWRKSKLC